MGWPPIKNLRRKFCHQSCGGSGSGNFDDGVPNSRGSKSTYVKVKMEGMAIARKVDLSLHHSYQSLRDTLDDMFGRGEYFSYVTDLESLGFQLRVGVNLD